MTMLRSDSFSAARVAVQQPVRQPGQFLGLLALFADVLKQGSSCENRSFAHVCERRN